jgi:hypothetical protein
MEKTIVSEKPHPLWDHLSIVLCKIDNSYTPYVTWLHNHTDNGYYHGHYFDNIQDATQDYTKREG